MGAGKLEERVIVLAPVGRDAEAIADLVRSLGFQPEICASPSDCAKCILSGAGAFLLTEEGLDLPGIPDLLEVLKAQPPWSELPLIVLATGGESRLAGVLEVAGCAAGSIMVLERPMRSATLSRSIQVALRSRRRQYEVRDLIDVKAKLAAIVENSDDAIISKDLDGIVTSWNPGAERLFGYSAREAIGQPITLIIPSERLYEEPGILARIRRGERIEQFETVRRRKDGTLLHISLTVSPVRNDRGEIVGASKIARDVTARIRAQEALHQAQAELQSHAANLERSVAERTADLRATNEQLETFIYSIAHDLRAPLRSMTGYSGLLLEDYSDRLDESGRKMLSRIQSASEFMDRLLMDLVAYGRVSRVQLDLGTVEIQKAWESALLQCAIQIEGSKATIETVRPLPKVRAHESTLGQVLANLLSNAIKFVPDDIDPRVRFWAEPRSEFTRLWVEDNGIGIPAEQQDRVFRVFERLNGARYAGTGIGLSIVRKGVERMNGRVGLESAPGKGSRFWIDLPAPA